MDIKNVGCAMSLASMSGHSKGRGVQCHWQVCLGIANVGACNMIGKYVWALQRWGCAMSLESMYGHQTCRVCNVIGKYVWA